MRSRKAVSPEDILTIVLGGGRGTRLYPLTRDRSKPAVPLAGKYRLIDVPISNCINSGIRKIYVLTQFKSASLNRHVAQTFKFDNFTNGFVEILAAEQTLATEMWFQGTADAVRKTLWHIMEVPCSHVLVLSGDALYRQDFAEIFDQHIAEQADITVMAKLVDEEQASSFGIMGIDSDRHVMSFHEKPSREELGPLTVDREVLLKAGLESKDKPYLASMGIYLFKREVLIDVLKDTSAQDFGKQIIPSSIGKHRVMASLFDGYWEDIGTIKNFFHANLHLIGDKPEFSFYDSEFPIFTHSRFLPSSELVDAHMGRAMLAEGCQIYRAHIDQSVIGIRSVIGENARLENTIMMGADYYDLPGERPEGLPAIGIARNALIRNAIIDKNARIGEGVKILNEAGVRNYECADYCICDGVVVVPKNAVLPDGTVI